MHKGPLLLITKLHAIDVVGAVYEIAAQIHRRWALGFNRRVTTKEYYRAMCLMLLQQ